LLLWDGDDAPPQDEAKLIIWSGNPPDSKARRLTDLVEVHGIEIRRRYLAWIHVLGETRLLGRRLRDSFAFADGTSLWRQSVFVEQSPWRQRSLEPLLKLLMFDVLLDEDTPSEVHFVGVDRNLSETLRRICKIRGIPYRWTRVRNSSRVLSRGLIRALPQPAQALLMLVYLALTRIGLRRTTLRSGDAGRKVLFAGPLFNFEPSPSSPAPPKLRATSFESKYWTVLPALLRSSGHEITWLHNFFSHDALKTPSASARFVERLNSRCEANEFHILLDSYFSVGGLLRVARRAVRGAIESISLGRALASESEHPSAWSYWPLLRADWAKSFRGVGCIEQLYYAECFDRALKALPKHSEGLYLMENQGWERALAAAWKRRDQGRLAGVIHSTVRFWDLRYHADPRRYEGGTPVYVPGPDVVVVNGRAAHEGYLETCVTREPIAGCEALRYLHLSRPARDLIEGHSTGSGWTLLVLGDYARESTVAVLHFLESARSALPADAWMDIKVKLHPGCPIDLSEFEALEATAVEGPAADLARDASVVLAGNLTSAAVDAYASGAPVIIHDTGAGLNYSPLRGFRGVTFVRTAEELHKALAAIRASPKQREISENSVEGLFFSDPDLPRWHRYFEILGRPVAT
jgi:surface carbohydrate biosynthesis protein (TIGR04326 family)